MPETLQARHGMDAATAVRAVNLEPGARLSAPLSPAADVANLRHS